MTPDEALQLVRTVCERMMGTLDDHQRVQAALQVLDGVVHPERPEELS